MDKNLKKFLLTVFIALLALIGGVQILAYINTKIEEKMFPVRMKYESQIKKSTPSAKP